MHLNPAFERSSYQGDDLFSNHMFVDRNKCFPSGNLDRMFIITYVPKINRIALHLNNVCEQSNKISFFFKLYYQHSIKKFNLQTNKTEISASGRCVFGGISLSLRLHLGVGS